MQEQTNKLGKTLKDYTCKKCGYVNAGSFARNNPYVRCRHCQS